MLRRRGAAAEAIPLCRRALGIQTKILGPEHLDVALATFQLGAALAASPDPDARREAAEVLDRAAALYGKLKPGHWKLPEVARAQKTLAATLRTP